MSDECEIRIVMQKPGTVINLVLSKNVKGAAGLNVPIRWVNYQQCISLHSKFGKQDKNNYRI